MAFGHSCSRFHCITRFVLTTRDAISNANSFCTLQYPKKSLIFLALKYLKVENLKVVCRTLTAKLRGIKRLHNADLWAPLYIEVYEYPITFSYWKTFSFKNRNFSRCEGIKLDTFHYEKRYFNVFIHIFTYC